MSYHIVKQTKKQKIAMYMKCPKRELAEMLYEANKVLRMVRTVSFPYSVSRTGKPLPLMVTITSNTKI